MSAKVVSGLLSNNPTIHVAKKQLAYPLYGADFDPLNPHFLLVGGGGGSSSTGVPNRISLLDTSNPSELKEISDIELSPEEDSVTSLAVAESDPTSLLAYAGINSSTSDQSKGKNEHFRSFRVPLPAKRKKDGGDAVAPAATVTATKALARTAIFRAPTGAKSESYQRVLRLSPPVQNERSEKSTGLLKRRIVTIASGLAKQNEVISFVAEESPSSKTRMLSRINLEEEEANDIDLMSVDDAATTFALAYATDTELFMHELGKQKSGLNTEPKRMYETTKGPEGRSKIRAIRFLNSRYIILLQNRVNRTGAELIVLKLSKDMTFAQQVLWKVLKNVKQAVGLDTCTLSAGQDGSQQFIIAVAGQDSSLQIHTLNYAPGAGMTGFKTFADVVDLHSGPITRVVFSHFVAPSLPISGNTPPQHVRLATVGVDKNVVVMTLPLRPQPATGSGKTMPRYILQSSMDIEALLYNICATFITLTVVILSLLTILELRGTIPPYIGSSKYLPQRFQDKFGQAYSYGHDNPGPVIPNSMPVVSSLIDKIKLSEATPLIEKIESISDQIKLADASDAIASMKALQSSIPSVADVQEKIHDLVTQNMEDESPEVKAVVVRDAGQTGGDVSAELQHEEDIVKEGTLRKWESLTKKEQKSWKKKLIEAGQWTEQQGETVLKGVFFGQLAGIVGEFVRGG